MVNSGDLEESATAPAPKSQCESNGIEIGDNLEEKNGKNVENDVKKDENVEDDLKMENCEAVDGLKVQNGENIEDDLKVEYGEAKENRNESMASSNEDSMPELWRELYAIVESRNKNIVDVCTENPDVFDGEFDLDKIKYDFMPYPGDNIKVLVSHSTPAVVMRIEPIEELQKHVGKITHMTQSFYIIDVDYIYFIDEENPSTIEFNVDDEVECLIIDGNYEVGKKSKYTRRCESINKVKNEVDDLLQGGTTEEENQAEIVDTEDESDDEHVFEALRNPPPVQETYDMPYGLYETLTSKNTKRINRLLKSFVPRELNYNTYKKRHHAHVWLDEVEMRASFEKYKSREISINPEKNRFTILCSKITELRPPIAVGDKVFVTKLPHMGYYYRGIVERVRLDRFVLKFKPDFINDYRLGDTFFAEFFHNRVVFMRKHAAIEYTKQKLTSSFLFPKQLTLADYIQLNAKIVDSKLQIAGKETPWFRELNNEQQEAVAGALRGECRPLPFIIFGPPGTGKTSTLIEIILQVYTHVENCKILIATQSNHAANVIATRLVASNGSVGSDMLRLVSNGVLDRKSLPKELHKFSASVLHARSNDYEYPENDDDDEYPKSVKRNSPLSYLKQFKIIVGTCVGLGILFESEYSEKYFTHVIIDEAAQCSECEAMIPITCLNMEKGQVIMAGDPLQLPPITLSNHTKHYNLVISMLERYIDMYGVIKGTTPEKENGFDPRLVVKLRRNYRSLPSILGYYNKQFYNSTLIPTISGVDSREAKLLLSLQRLFPNCANVNGEERFGIAFVDVESGRNTRQDNKKSWENREEAALIQAFVKKLWESGIAAEDIGVITPYHAQVLALKTLLRNMKKVRVGTVEEFQGEEKIIITFSAVKTSGDDRATRFINCPKRLNTAISRARMLVVIFGKAALLKRDPNWNDLIEYCVQNQTFINHQEFHMKL